jgi:hypothetical protein
MDLDTFITTLYVVIDDWYKQGMVRRMERHAGPACKMSDSEVLTVALAGQWRSGVPWQTERGVVRYMQSHGRQWFPEMLGKSQFNQRVRELWSALVCLQQEVAQWLGTPAHEYECVDCTPLPVCSLAQALKHDRHWLSGERGHGGNHGGWYYGQQVLLSVTQCGAVTGWVVGPAASDDRWLMEAFLSTRRQQMQLIGPAQPPKKQPATSQVPCVDGFSPAITAGIDHDHPYLADRGFNGERWIQHWQAEYAMRVITAPPANAPNAWDPTRLRWLAAHRQIVETVIARLTESFSLKRLQAHTEWGKITRLAATMAAYNLGCFFNRLLGRSDGALATLIT